jgi:hypothetical protein
MKKKDAKQLLGFIRKWDAKNIASEVRSKLLSNMINLKKVETEIEEAVKAAQEGLTEEEKEAANVREEVRQKYQKNNEYVLTEDEVKAVQTILQWEKVLNDSLMEILDKEIEIKTLTASEFDDIVEKNDMSMEEYEWIAEVLVA